MLHERYFSLIVFTFLLSPLFFTPLISSSVPSTRSSTTIRIEEAFGSGEGTLPDDLMEDDDIYYNLSGGQSAEYFTVSSFNTSGREGGISKVDLFGQYKVISRFYPTQKSVEYRQNSSADWIEATNITPEESDTEDTTKHEDITPLYQQWTWERISELQVRYVNPQGRIAWDAIWLEVEVSDIEYELQVQKSVDREKCSAGDEINYKIWYNNTGSAVLDEVYVNDTFDSNLEYLSDNTQQTPIVNGDTYSWHFTSVSVGSNSFTVTLKVNETTPDGTEISNQALADYKGPGWSTTNSNVVTTQVEYVPVSVSQSVSKDDVVIGDEVNYTISLSMNTDLETTCWVNDSLSSYLEYVSDDSGVEPEIDDNNISWKFDLSDDKTFHLRVRVKTSTPDGIEIANQIRLEYYLERSYSRESNMVYFTAHTSPGYINLKAQTTSNTPGEEMNITVTCHNIEETELSPAWVNISIDEMVYVSDSLAVEPEEKNDTLSFAFDSIPPGELEFYITLKSPLSSENGDLNTIQGDYTFGFYDELYQVESNKLILTTEAPNIYVELESPSTIYMDSTFNATVYLENVGMGDSRWVNLTVRSQKMTINGSDRADYTMTDFEIEKRKVLLGLQGTSTGIGKISIVCNYTTSAGSPYDSKYYTEEILIERRSEEIDFNASFSEDSYVVGETAEAGVFVNTSFDSPIIGNISVRWGGNITCISGSETPDLSEERLIQWNKSFVDRTTLSARFKIGRMEDGDEAKFEFSFNFDDENISIEREISIKSPEISLFTLVHDHTIFYNDDTTVDIYIYNNGSVPINMTLRFRLRLLTYTNLSKGVYEPSTGDLIWELKLDANSTTKVSFNVTPTEDRTKTTEVDAQMEGNLNGINLYYATDPIDVNIKETEKAQNYWLYLFVPLVVFAAASFISVWRR
ncbi:MAG: hypothetical protein V5A88_00795 [Candidatus Thermoplasmatota archaeon]